ncbi:Pentatricopeptide repeat-containing protein [Vigna angularis]|uniref:Pentatricopeptide repeat-containing protein n=1 Tax=Phaseolus angularis TaxID=3914 RepID=A0A8T0LE01_PHAAN|nr:Pentatricopeptide repeat-containing protein [Vigna angularis]
MFNEMPQRKCDRIVLFVNALLAAYLHSKKFDAFCEKGSFDSTLSLLTEMGVNPDSIMFNTLLHGLYSKGSFEDGEKMWGQMGAKNVALDVRGYCSKLVGLAREKKVGSMNEENLDVAKKWFVEIVNSDFDPHKNTYFILVPFLCEKDDLKITIEMCKEIFNNQCIVDTSLVQLVVDKLVNEGMVSKAKLDCGKSLVQKTFKLEKS